MPIYKARMLELDARTPPQTLPGFRHLRGHLDPEAQAALLAEVLALVDDAGWFRPTMPRSGRPLSVRMCNLGSLGWVSDRTGYRYQPHHPDTGRPWPPLPASLLGLWREVADWREPPEACLVNLYRGAARMGLHQDRDEHDLVAPVVSISLGDAALFRISGLARRGPTTSLLLRSGDLVVLGGEARLAFHGVDRVLAGSSVLVPDGGRINLTLRRVTLSPY
jgi:alkylated DNA repair protein (DNA oxidative demethylase)